MAQTDQFPDDLLAPPDWVRQIEGRTAANAKWEDGSYGNDAAPSWVLADPAGVVHAQVFFYTPANAERFENTFGTDSYVAVSIIREDDVFGGCCVAPDLFSRAVSTAQSVDGVSPSDALRMALDTVSAAPLAWWIPATR